MDIKQQVKLMLNEAGVTLSEAIRLMNLKRSKDNQMSISNMNNKLTRGTVRYSEILELAEAVGLRIRWVKRDTSKIESSRISYINSTTGIPTDIIKKVIVSDSKYEKESIDEEGVI